MRLRQGKENAEQVHIADAFLGYSWYHSIVLQYSDYSAIYWSTAYWTTPQFNYLANMNSSA